MFNYEYPIYVSFWINKYSAHFIHLRTRIISWKSVDFCIAAHVTELFAQGSLESCALIKHLNE